MNKNVLFLDFDGVVNLLSSWKGTRKPENVEGKESTYLKGCHIVWNPEVVTLLNDIHESDNGIDVVWLTDWQQVEGGFEEMKEKLDLGPFKESTVPGIDEVRIGGWWKFPARTKYIKEHELERSVWIDDNCPHSPEEAHKMEHLDPEVGITVEKLEKIVLYLAEGIDYHTEGDTVEA